MKLDDCKRLLSKNSVCIFLLHGVVKGSDYVFRNFNRKHILESEFKFFIESLCELGTPVSTDNLIEFSNGRRVPDGAFVITFDDGFENNLSVAAPILKKHNVPATFYLTTNFISNNLMSWVDRIDWAIEESAKRPTLEVDVPWHTKPLVLQSEISRLSFLNEIRNVVKHDMSINQHELADSIQEQLGFENTKSNHSELDAKLTWEGVRCLADCELFTIGGHTHNHPIMSFLSEAQLNFEIHHCLELLRAKVGIQTTHFAYPEGLSHCYNNQVISCLKEHRIKCCPTAEHGVNDFSIERDLFKLKRVFVE